MPKHLDTYILADINAKHKMLFQNRMGYLPKYMCLNVLACNIQINNIIETYIFQYTSCVYKNKKPNIFSDLRKPGLVSGESLSPA